MYYLYYYFIFIVSMILFFFSLKFILMDLVYLVDWEIINYNSNSIIMIFLLDWMSLLFMSFVLFISSLVIYYSMSYMCEEKSEHRFIILVVLFVFSMMMLIISPNMISILLGWDGLGLVSYCLVIYFQNIKSFNAGMITALTNRVGDVALLIAIAWMLNVGSWSFYYYLEGPSNFLLLIGGLVLLASMTKSAQIPFSSWLPAAMAAPTPVSALVHSSTLVTAGVYLLIRFSKFMYNTTFFFFLLIIGCLTMFMSGLGANFEMDLKKIIALSTLSQLGLMMSILSLGFYKLTFFHLLTHALFKALLFLCAGVLIHSFWNSQDIRLSGGLINQMPITLMCFNISNMALCGMPFLAGFYSKDLILEHLLMTQVNLLIFFFFFFDSIKGFFFFFFFFFSTGLTVSYTFRLIFFCMIMNYSSFSLINLQENFLIMLKVMILLSLFSIWGGSMLMWLMFPIPMLIILPFYFKVLVLIFCMLGGIIGYFLYSIYMIYMKYIYNYYKLFNFFFSCMWFMPFLLSFKINFFFLNKGLIYMKSFDFGWNEMMSGGGIYMLLKFYLLKYMKFHYNNYLKMFFLFMMIMFMMVLF